MQRRTAAILLVSLAAAALGARPALARDLIYGSWASPKHGLNTYAIPPFMKAVHEKTGGAVTWQLVAGGTLVSGRTTLAGIRDGVVDAGLIIPSYTAKELPGNSLVMGVQVFGEDTVAASAAAVETVMLDCAQCMDDFRRQNAVYLAGHAASPFYLMCRGSVESLDDLKGKKVRSSGSGSRLVTALGGIPTPMSPADALTAMERGAIDCVLGSIAWLQSYSFQDVVTHVLDYPLGIVGALGTFTMNRTSWDKLSRAQKKAHLDLMPLLSARAVIKAYVEEDARVAEKAKAKGIKFVKVDPKRFDAVVEKFSASERKELIETGTRFGMKDPVRILDAFERNLKKWRALSPGIGLDVDKYGAAIKREIYDRVDPDKL